MVTNRLSAVISLVAIVILFACKQEPYQQGQRIYESRCSGCHMNDGSGLIPTYPALQGSSIVKGDKTYLVCLIMQGKQSAQLSTIRMPANNDMTQYEMTNLVNYINFKWGDQKEANPIEVQNYIDTCMSK